MSEYDADRIEKPRFFQIAPLKRGRSKRQTYVMGFDSEADSSKGKPFLYQIAHPNERCDLLVVPDNGRRYETLIPLLVYIYNNTTRKDLEYLIFGFNLAYEYTQLFRDFPQHVFAEQMIHGLGHLPRYIRADGSWDGVREATTVKLEALNYKREAITLRFGTRKPVRIIDAQAFMSGSLDSVAAMLGLGRKEEKPDEWSRKLLEDENFLNYARQDAILTQKIGEWIVDLHKRYDVSQCISAPHFASKVFRRNYLTKKIELPDNELEQFGLWSYHGGKNGYYHNRPDIFDKVAHVDIRSAYPEAMRQLPDIENSEWLYYDEYEPRQHAIWHVVGKYRRCSYRGLMDNSTWPNSGSFEGTVTGYELDEAVERGEFEIDSCVGYVLTGTSGGPLVRYVDDFYTMKSSTSDDTERLLAKLLLNSLYGKFFQKMEVGTSRTVDLETLEWTEQNLEGDLDYRAGGLYHPPIASLITGFVRAKIHRLEHENKAIMTSTDGFFSYSSPTENIGKQLGQLSVETGRLRIWRERLYIFDPDNPVHRATCKPTCRKKHPIYALHGWHASVDQLRRVPLVGGNVYHYMSQAMITLRMSRQIIEGERHAPGMFIQREFHLTLPENMSDAEEPP